MPMCAAPRPLQNGRPRANPAEEPAQVGRHIGIGRGGLALVMLGKHVPFDPARFKRRLDRIL
jgi:hypothetical protein